MRPSGSVAITCGDSADSPSDPSRSSGRLAKFFPNSDGRLVQKDAPLAVIEDSVPVEDILHLREVLESRNFDAISDRSGEHPRPLADETVASLLALQDKKLGRLQPSYSAFVSKYAEWRLFNQAAFPIQKVERIQSQIVNYDSLRQHLLDQKALVEEELRSLGAEYDKQARLVQEKVLSPTELLSAETAYREMKIALQEVNVDITTNDIQIEECRKSIMDIRHASETQWQELDLGLQESLRKLQSDLADWEQKYLLKAPIQGYLSLFKFWSENQVVNAGDEVMTIVPPVEHREGRIYLDEMNSGRVKVGQRVNIRCDSYEVSEFGLIRGVVESISPVARERTYLVNVALPDGLQTNYGIRLRGNPEMHGRADIITEDLRLIDRVFYRFRYAVRSAI